MAGRTPARIVSPALLLAMLALVAMLTIVAAAAAAPPTLHLSATVYDAHKSGGVFSSKEKLYEGSKLVGEDSSRCTSVSKSTSRCVGSYKLARGTLQFSGTIQTPSNSDRLQITSGTGSYKGAHGTVLTEYNKPGTKAKETLTFH